MVSALAEQRMAADESELWLVFGKGPYDDSRVVMAVLYTVDWDAAMSALGSSQDLPAESWPHGEITSNARSWRFDPELARALLAEAWSSNFGFTLLYNAHDPLQNALAAHVQTYVTDYQRWNVNLVTVPGVELKDKMATLVAADAGVLCLSQQCRNLHEVYLPFLVRPSLAHRTTR